MILAIAVYLIIGLCYSSWMAFMMLKLEPEIQCALVGTPEEHHIAVLLIALGIAVFTWFPDVLRILFMKLRGAIK